MIIDEGRSKIMVFKVLKRLKNVIKKNELAKYPRITIDETVKINFSNIRLKQDNQLQIGKGSIIDGQIVFDRDHAKIFIGSNSFVNGSIISAEEIRIGNDVLIAWGCHIVDHNSHSLYFEDRKNDVKDWYQGKKDWSKVKRKAVSVSDKAWIGFNSIILKGVTIGEGAVVAAGSVVTKDVPPFTIAGGNPARFIRAITVNEDE